MAGFITAEGLVVPAGGDTYDYVNDQRRLAGSIRSVVPVASVSAANTIIASMATDGRPVSDTNPLVVWDYGQHKLLTYNASGVSYGNAPHAEFTTSNTCAPNTVWGMGTFSQDAAQTTDTGFVTINATDKLQVRDAGIYAVTLLLGFTATVAGISWCSVDGNYTTTMASGLQNFVTVRANWKLAASAIIQPALAVGTSGNATFNSRTIVTRIA